MTGQGRFTLIYRLIRILRLIKLLRFVKKNAGIRIMQEKMNMSSASTNMFGLAIMVLWITHLTACIWFLQAKIQNFEDECWVVQEGMMEAPVET